MQFFLLSWSRALICPAKLLSLRFNSSISDLLKLEFCTFCASPFIVNSFSSIILSIFNLYFTHCNSSNTSFLSVIFIQHRSNSHSFRNISLLLYWKFIPLRTTIEFISDIIKIQYLWIYRRTIRSDKNINAVKLWL